MEQSVIFLHDKNGDKGNEKGAKLPGFTAEQNKLVTTLLSSAMKRTAAAIARKSKKAKKNEAKKEGKSGDEGDDEDFSALLAEENLAPSQQILHLHRANAFARKIRW
jgi:hypothetical protein